MAAWVGPAIIAASTLLSAYLQSQGNSGFAPAAGGTGGSQKQPFQVPDVFGQTTGGYSLLGGRQPLSQAIMSEQGSASPPAYGQRGMGPYEQYGLMQELSRGK